MPKVLLQTRGCMRRGARRAWGGLMMAQKSCTPNMPRLEMVKVPPVIWSGDSLLSFACGSRAPRVSAAGPTRRQASQAGRPPPSCRGRGTTRTVRGIEDTELIIARTAVIVTIVSNYF